MKVHWVGSDGETYCRRVPKQIAHTTINEWDVTCAWCLRALYPGRYEKRPPGWARDTAIMGGDPSL